MERRRSRRVPGIPSALRASQELVPRQAGELLGLVAEHVEVLGVARAAVVHLGRSHAGDLAAAGRSGTWRSRRGSCACCSSRVIWASSRPPWNSVMRKLAARVAHVGEVEAGDLPRPAVVVEGVDLLGQVVVVGEDGAAFAGAEVLGHLEAEAAGRAPGADLAAAPLGQVGLAGVLDHRQVVLLGDGQDRRPCRPRCRRCAPA